MCYKGKFLNRIPVKSACFVFAILNAIANAVTLVWFFFGLLGVLIGVIIGHDGSSMKIGGVRFKRSVDDDSFKEKLVDFLDNVIFDYWIPFQYLLIICAIFSLITFIFSVLLCYGINNRRWRLVRAYFIYGCVITVLAFLASIIQLFAGQGPQKVDLALWGMFGCALHSLFLVLVHQTYNILLEDAMISDQVHLIDNMRDIMWA